MTMDNAGSASSQRNKHRNRLTSPGLLALLGGLGTAAVFGVANSAVYYVNPSDPGSYHTLQAAIDATTGHPAGDTIKVVLAGDYEGRSVLDPLGHFGSPHGGLDLVIMGEGEGPFTFISTDHLPTLSVGDAGSPTIQHLQIIGSPFGSYGLHVIYGSPRVYDNVFELSSRGCYLQGVTDAIVDGNTFRSNSDRGLNLALSSSSAVTHNLFQLGDPRDSLTTPIHLAVNSGSLAVPCEGNEFQGGEGTKAISPVIFHQNANPSGGDYSALIQNNSYPAAFVDSVIALGPGWNSSQITDQHDNPQYSLVILSDPTSGVESQPGLSILEMRLAPNPIRDGRATLDFVVPKEGAVSLQMFHAGGRMVGTIVSGHHAAGKGRAVIDLERMNHRGLPSGSYFLRLRSGQYSRTRTVTIVR